MASLVIGGQLLFFLGHGAGATLRTHHDLVLGILEFQHGDQPLVATGGHERCLVDQVHQVGAREAGCATGNHLEVDIRRQRHVAHMHFQNALTADNVRIGDNYLPVETARPQQRGVEHVGSVGGGNQDDALIGFKAVHLDQQLVERLFTLIIAAAKPRHHGADRRRRFRR